MRYGRPGKIHGKRLISQAVLAGLLFPWTVALAGDDFAGNWQPKPLVDNSAPAPVKAQSPAATTQAPPPAQPELEARLKPLEPFVKEIENRLTITPQAGSGLVLRLNTIQTVLFGGPQYQDAGQLITKLTEVFPDEAKKAQAEMDKQVQLAQQAMQQANAAAAAKAGKGKITAPGAQFPAQNQVASTAAPAQTASPKKRRGFWNSDDFDSDFENDPFFRDAFQGRAKTGAMPGGTNTSSVNSIQQPAQNYQNNQNAQAYAQQSAGPSKLAGLAQGLAGLALIAGGIAGASFLNGKMGGVKNGYGYSPYGYPNYGYSNYGAPYGASAYGNGYGMPYGGNISPYGYGGGYGTGMTTYGSGFGTSMMGSGSGLPYITPYRGF